MKQNLSVEELDLYQQLTKQQSCKTLSKIIKDNNNYRGSVIRMLKKLNDNQRQGLIIHLQILSQEFKEKEYQQQYKSYFLSFIDRLHQLNENICQSRIVQSQIYIQQKNENQQSRRRRGFPKQLNMDLNTNQRSNQNLLKISSLSTLRQKDQRSKQKLKIMSQPEIHTPKQKMFKQQVIQSKYEIIDNHLYENKRILEQISAVRESIIQINKQKAKNDQQWFIFIASLSIICLLSVINLKVENSIVWMLYCISIGLVFTFFMYKMYIHVKNLKLSHKHEDQNRQNNHLKHNFEVKDKIKPRKSNNKQI